MDYIDVTVGIRNDMLVWPGDEPAKIGWESRIVDGAMSNVSSIQIGAHVGTHIDMPLHFFEGAANLDSLDLSVLIGPVTVVEVPEEKRSIDAAFLNTLELADVTRLFFKTSNSELWNNPSLTFIENYLALDPDAAQLLVENGCRLVGIDYLSIAPFENSTTTHEILLSNNVVILETPDLRKVQPGEYQLICLPLKLISREAAPCRAILLPTLVIS